MNLAVEQMLKKYTLQTTQQQEHALHEIIQEIALLGLWRGKFFEHTAFYGGTALRVLYGLDRFSEDLDFSLLKPNPNFKLQTYLSFVSDELEAYGFSVEVEPVIKTIKSNIDSAFIKSNTSVHFLKIGSENKVQKNKLIQIKFEVDKTPPCPFSTESKLLLNPTPFYVQTMDLKDLFAGKMHALLFRKWKHRVKGRDWYDLIWYITRGVALNLEHLRSRCIQSGHWEKKNPMTKHDLLHLLSEKIENLDIQQAKSDILPFLTQKNKIDIWSKRFFHDLSQKIQIVE